MKKSEKRQYIDQIAAEQLAGVVEQLLTVIPAPHPAYKRVSDLSGRLRELNERIDMGTLSKEDVGRLRARIAGGLRDVVQEYKPPSSAAAAEEREEKTTFKLKLSPDTGADEPAATPQIGFFGAVEYQGSPTQKAQTVTLQKGYGASFHTCREAVRKAGMEMVSADRAGGRIEASLTGTGAGSFGEKILFWVTPVNGGQTRVHVVVDSQLPTQAFDFGRNKTKLGILVSYLR